MTHGYVLADVFTTHRFGGNPLAVFPEADAIPSGVMQQFARELNLSETVFVLAPTDRKHTYRLRILTPAIELPFAGHPTVGTACVLAEMGRLSADSGQVSIVLEEGVGPVPVHVHRQADGWSATFAVPDVPVDGPAPPSKHDLARMLTITPDEILDGDLGPRAVSSGVPYVFIGVKDRSVLKRVRLNQSIWEQLLADFWAPHVYVITQDVELEGSTVRARMFAPAMGIAEDPATGAAAAALPGYLRSLTGQNGTHRWRIEQGFDMGRPSLIEVEAEVSGGLVRGVRVGGNCVIVGRGEFDLGR